MPVYKHFDAVVRIDGKYYVLYSVFITKTCLDGHLEQHKLDVEMEAIVSKGINNDLMMNQRGTLQTMAGQQSSLNHSDIVTKSDAI